MTRLMKNGLARTGLLLAISHFMLSGCAMMYKGMGDTMIAYSEDQLIPYLLSTDDDVMGCASGESLTPLLLSFGNVTTPPDHIAVLVYMVAGLCEEEHALEQELRYLRAVKQQNVLEAQDARIAQKRHHALAAKRQYAGYQALQRYLGDPGQHCPHFKNDEEELIWLLGNTVGVLAVFNDGQTNGHVGIPKNIAAKAERAAACLDNDVWWGMPMAMRATLWAVVPGLQPDGEDPWQRLQESARIADQSGVRLVYVFDAIAALTAGKTARVKHAIKQHVRSIRNTAANDDYRMLDVVATKMLLNLSDRMWTEATGARTPLGGLGTFWDDAKPASKLSIDIDDLL